MAQSRVFPSLRRALLPHGSRRFQHLPRGMTAKGFPCQEGKMQTSVSCSAMERHTVYSCPFLSFSFLPLIGALFPFVLFPAPRPLQETWMRRSPCPQRASPSRDMATQVDAPGLVEAGTEGWLGSSERAEGKGPLDFL